MVRFKLPSEVSCDEVQGLTGFGGTARTSAAAPVVGAFVRQEGVTLYLTWWADGERW